jgi:hypothetical protein
MVQEGAAVNSITLFPRGTYYLKKEWVDKGDVPGLSSSDFYYIARSEDGEMHAVFGNQDAAFKYVSIHGRITALLWAH